MISNISMGCFPNPARKVALSSMVFWIISQTKEKRNSMTKRNLKSVTSQSTDTSGVAIGVDRVPKGEWKSLGGGDRVQWNVRLSNLVTRALPVNQRNAEVVSHAGSAVAAGTVDMKPTDPIEAC
jgi:hypothetical protein